MIVKGKIMQLVIRLKTSVCYVFISLYSLYINNEYLLQVYRHVLYSTVQNTIQITGTSIFYGLISVKWTVNCYFTSFNKKLSGVNYSEKN